MEIAQPARGPEGVNAVLWWTVGKMDRQINLPWSSGSPPSGSPRESPQISGPCTWSGRCCEHPANWPREESLWFSLKEVMNRI